MVCMVCMVMVCNGMYWYCHVHGMYGMYVHGMYGMVCNGMYGMYVMVCMVCM